MELLANYLSQDNPSIWEKMCKNCNRAQIALLKNLQASRLNTACEHKFAKMLSEHRMQIFFTEEFEQQKKLMKKHSVLGCYDRKHKIGLSMDSSKYGTGTMLCFKETRVWAQLSMSIKHFVVFFIREQCQLKWTVNNLLSLLNRALPPTWRIQRFIFFRWKCVTCKLKNLGCVWLKTHLRTFHYRTIQQSAELYYIN